MKSALAPLAAALIALEAAGCSSLISRFIARAPNHGVAIDPAEDRLPLDRLEGRSCRQHRVSVGPPAASLSVLVLDPPEAGMMAAGRSRGTVVVLHGIRKEKLRMLRTAGRFLEAGYRAVLVDLRGHGRSSGDWMAYGAFEAEDLRQVLDFLEARGEIAGPVAAYGISYGGAVALQWAAKDPRVRAVVSVASFSSLRSVVPRYVRMWMPPVGWFMSEEAIQGAIDGAGARGGFDPGLADPAAAIARTGAHVLIIHGQSDFLVPPRHACALKEASGGRSELLLVGGLGHNAAYQDRRGDIARESLRWFDRWLGE